MKKILLGCGLVMLMACRTEPENIGMKLELPKSLTQAQWWSTLIEIRGQLVVMKGDKIIKQFKAQAILDPGVGIVLKYSGIKPGTYRFVVHITADSSTVTDVGLLDYVQDNVVLVKGSTNAIQPSGNWQAPADAASQDADQDGLSNLVELVYGLNPGSKWSTIAEPLNGESFIGLIGADTRAMLVVSNKKIFPLKDQTVLKTQDFETASFATKSLAGIESNTAINVNPSYFCDESPEFTKVSRTQRTTREPPPPPPIFSAYVGTSTGCIADLVFPLPGAAGIQGMEINGYPKSTLDAMVIYPNNGSPMTPSTAWRSIEFSAIDRLSNDTTGSPKANDLAFALVDDNGHLAIGNGQPGSRPTVEGSSFILDSFEVQGSYSAAGVFLSGNSCVTSPDSSRVFFIEGNNVLISELATATNALTGSCHATYASEPDIQVVGVIGSDGYDCGFTVLYQNPSTKQVGVSSVDLKNSTCDGLSATGVVVHEHLKPADSDQFAFGNITAMSQGKISQLFEYDDLGKVFADDMLVFGDNHGHLWAVGGSMAIGTYGNPTWYYLGQLPVDESVVGVILDRRNPSNQNDAASDNIFPILVATAQGLYRMP